MVNKYFILPAVFQGRSVNVPMEPSRIPGGDMRLDLSENEVRFDLGDKQPIYLLPSGMKSVQTLAAEIEAFDLRQCSTAQLYGRFDVLKGSEECRLSLITYGTDGERNGLTAMPLNARMAIIDLPDGTVSGVLALRLVGQGRLRTESVHLKARSGDAPEAGQDEARFLEQRLEPVGEGIFHELMQPALSLTTGAVYEVAVAVKGWTPEAGVPWMAVRGPGPDGRIQEQRLRMAPSPEGERLSACFRCQDGAVPLDIVIDGRMIPDSGVLSGAYVLLKRVSPAINPLWLKEPTDRDHHRPLNLPQGEEPAPAAPSAAHVAVAFVGSRDVFRALSAETAAILPAPDDWESRFDQNQPDVLLLETSWSAAVPAWSAALRGGRNADRLRAMARWCRSRDIPVLLWAREDPGSLIHYRWLVELSDHVFHIDAAAARAMGVDKARGKASSSGLVVDARDFNPIRSFALSREDDDLRWTPTLDGFWETARRPDIMGSVAARDVHLVESIWSHSPARLEDLGPLRNNALGVLDHEARRLFARHCRTFLAYGDGVAAPWLKAQRALERAAAGAATVWLGDAPETARGLPGSSGAASLEEALAAEGGWGDAPMQFEKARFNIWRETVLNHSFPVFLEKVLKVAGLAPPAPRTPSITAVMSTMRPHLIERAVAWFNAQSHENSDLVVVIHDDQAAPEQFGHLASDRIRFTRLGQSRTLGECLNFASEFSDSDYIAKIDDDDFYGLDYLSNFALHTAVHDIALCGKAVACFDMEGDGAFWSQSRARRAWTYLPPRHPANPLAGGTIIVRRDVLEDIGFPEDRRGGSDTAFLRRCFSEGLGALTLDSFDYALFRSAQAGFHTWNLDTDPLKKTGQILSGDWQALLST